MNPGDFVIEKLTLYDQGDALVEHTCLPPAGQNILEICNKINEIISIINGLQNVRIESKTGTLYYDK